MTRITVAKSEATSDKHELEYGGQEYILPPTLPLDAVEALEHGIVTDFMKAVFGSAQYAVLSVGFNTEDLIPLSEAVAQIYGTALGKSKASGSS